MSNSNHRILLLTLILILSTVIFGERESILRLDTPLFTEIDQLVSFLTITDEPGLYELNYNDSHVYENACRFPVIDKEDANIFDHVAHYRDIECPFPDYQQYVVQSHVGHLLIGTPHKATYNGTFNCFFRELSGTLGLSNRNVTFDGPWNLIPKHKRLFIDRDQFAIKCVDGKNKRIFHDAYTSISTKPKLNPPPSVQSNQLNVAILMLNSVSRAQFLRHMFFTLKVMRQNDFQIFNGYTKLADDTDTNLLAILSGKVYDSDKHDNPSVDKNKEQSFDDVLDYSNSLIKQFKDRGCVSMWNDDVGETEGGLFQSESFNVFHQPPADYYFRPYYEYLYQNILKRKLCVNGEFVTSRFLNIFERSVSILFMFIGICRFTTKYAEKCHFSFNSITALTHDNPNNLELLDQPLADTLERMKDIGALDNTAIVIVSDSGQRRSAIQETYIGRIEERMPMLSVYIPPKYRKSNPKNFENLSANTNRLVSSFDIYRTLHDLTDPKTTNKEVGVSLFNSISRTRTCQQARIPSQFCMCMERMDTSILNETHKVAIIILCAQAFVLTMLYLSNYSIIISQGRTSDFQLTNFDTKKVMSDLIKNVKSVDGQTKSLESEQKDEEKLEQNADSNQVAEEHLDKSKQANPEPDSGSKHEDGRVDEETAQKEAPNLWLRDPEEHYRVPKEKITFSDELNADIYSVDYSLSHPMDNECRFPILIKDEPDLLPAVEHYVEADCPPSKKPILVEQLHTGEILVGRRFMSKASKNFTCYAQELSGALRPKNIQLNFVGDFIKLPFNKRIYVEKDQFHVQCKDPNGKIVFEDAFTNVPYKERLHPPQLDGTLNFSVALLILDSNSRNQFVRHAPQTLKFMKEQGFQILHGYNKVADNSAVNLLPLLAGKTFDLKKHGIEHLIRPDMHLTPEMIKDDVWKHANMLTKLMKERGCATLWNDDIMVPKLGLLNYDQFKGFYKPVADYHYRPYYEYLYQKQDARKACVNGHLITRRMLGIWERFSTKYARECHFAFTFLTALTHDNANAVELLDQTMYDALLRMKYKGVFDNTIMIIMGDHGQRMSEVQHTYSGRIEERMPLMGVYFPEKFRKAYPEKLRNFIVNKNRFLSNYDMHETFRELLGFNDPKRQPVGKSLFHEIPKDRLCNDTRVVHQHCTCQEPLSESLIPNETKEKMFNELSKYVDYKTKRLECVETARIEPPKTYTPYTINAMARLGIRTPDMWEKRIKEGKHYNSTENEIFDVEFDVPLQIQTNGGETSARRFALRSRMIFHRETKYVRLIAKPLLLDPEKKCINVFVIDDMCKCLLKT
ncbi:hypothetical protein M3Y95_00283100 [Aphelenchoides besseyi]|nr:hypothetical protein M3Y95_00283100 [Aphelenchoides besseyi]